MKNDVNVFNDLVDEIGCNWLRDPFVGLSATGWNITEYKKLWDEIGRNLLGNVIANKGFSKFESKDL